MPCCGNARAQAQRANSTHPTKPTPVRPAARVVPQPASRQPAAHQPVVLQPATNQAAANRSATNQTVANQSAARRPAPKDSHRAYFKYFGTAGLTVTGPASATVYRFQANGGPVAVDPRDAASLAQVPNLRMVGRN